MKTFDDLEFLNWGGDKLATVGFNRGLQLNIHDVDGKDGYAVVTLDRSGVCTPLLPDLPTCVERNCSPERVTELMHEMSLL